MCSFRGSKTLTDSIWLHLPLGNSGYFRNSDTHLYNAEPHARALFCLTLVRNSPWMQERIQKAKAIYVNNLNHTVIQAFGCKGVLGMTNRILLLRQSSSASSSSLKSLNANNVYNSRYQCLQHFHSTWGRFEKSRCVWNFGFGRSLTFQSIKSDSNHYNHLHNESVGSLTLYEVASTSVL